jgi:hypothetical protein
MKIRIQTLWKVPVYCVVASWICFYVTVHVGGFFYSVKTVGTDGMTQVSVDPVRSVIFDVVMFLSVLLIGGLWVFRSMRKSEIAVSAGIIAGIYLLSVLVQPLIPNFPTALSIGLAYSRAWVGTLSSLMIRLLDHLNVSLILSSFAPLLFIPFGRKKNT